MTREYKRPMLVDTTRYEQSEEILDAFKYYDEYFVDEEPANPLLLVVEALLSTLPQDEREVIEMCVMARMTMHEAARELGYINKDGKEDHKMVSRRIQWGLKKMRAKLESPGFASAIASHRLPVELESVTSKESLANIIANLEKTAREVTDEQAEGTGDEA